MNFVDYETVVFPKLDNSPEIILESSTHTLYVNSITICNTTTNDIRINLVKEVVTTSTSSPTPDVKNAYLAKNILVPAGKPGDINTINLVKALGLDLFLPVSIVSGNTVTTNISCYSNGINQNFDCTVDYTIFIETATT